MFAVKAHFYFPRLAACLSDQVSMPGFPSGATLKAKALHRGKGEQGGLTDQFSQGTVPIMDYL